MTTTTDRGWTVSVQLKLDAQPMPGGDRDLHDDLVVDLIAHAAAIAGHGCLVEATMSVTAATWNAAAEQALTATTTALAHRGYTAVTVMGVEAITDEEADRRSASPTIPDLVSGPEVAGILQVSKQRVSQLLRDRADFPEPMLHVGGRPLWTRLAVERWAHNSTRSPGRPPTITATTAS